LTGGAGYANFSRFGVLHGGSTVYAIVKTGGKQYRVEEGQVLRVERLDAGSGESVTLDEDLLVATDQ